jgi:hypothetical protein
MRGKTRTRGAWLLAACVALAPGLAWGQAQTSQPGNEYAPADPQLPLPLGSTRPEDGGVYLWARFWYMHQTNPLNDQPIARFGFEASDNSISGPMPNTFLTPGSFVGSGVPALNVAQLTGQDSYQPGFEVGIGYRFGDGSALSLDYFRLTEASYQAGVTGNQITRHNDLVGSAPLTTLASTFLFAPVFNYPPQFDGPPFKINPINGANGRPIGTPSAQAVSGIWNGATIMTIQFIQRYQEWDITYRYPIYETETQRVNALVGPRFAWIWETFRWSTTSFADDGAGDLIAGPQDIGIYNAVTSNRLYGAHTGCEYECYLGHGFALQARFEGDLFADFVTEIARYETAAKFLGFPESKRAKHEETIVGELEGSLAMRWYPWEFMQVEVGYKLMGFFNTLSARRPIDFDYSNLAPKWDTTTRLFDGFFAGIGINF